MDRRARGSTQTTLLTDLCHRLVELNKDVDIGSDCLAKVQQTRRHNVWHYLPHQCVDPLRQRILARCSATPKPRVLQLKHASGDNDSAKSFSRRDRLVVNLLVCAWSSLCAADLFSLDLLQHTTQLSPAKQLTRTDITSLAHSAAGRLIFHDDCKRAFHADR